MISLDQTPIEQFNPANTFDSQGLTQLTEQIEARKKKRNDITQDTKISIENKNLETIQKELESELAKRVLSGEILEGETICVDTNEGALVFSKDESKQLLDPTPKE